MNRRQRPQMRLITYEMGEEYITRMDEEYPGYRAA